MNKKLLDVAAGRVKADTVIKRARYLNVYTGEVLCGDIAIADGYIAGIGEYEGERTYFADGLVVPGFIDGHVHIESSMTLPRSFAAQAFKHGTTTVVCDPHEIANVAGVYGIRFMIDDSRGREVDFKFMLPSCVPATSLDQSFCTLSAADLAPLYKDKSVIGLAEVMDAYAVIRGDGAVLDKIAYATRLGRAVDGHAPCLGGKELCAYVAAGVKSDHECTTMDEAMEKLRLGQFVMIREGTAAHNLEALVGLIDKYSDRCMFVTDDMHPEVLIGEGHIDRIIRRAVALGADKIKAITAATLTPARYFGLSDRGAIAPGLRADLAVLDEGLFVKAAFSGGKKQKSKIRNWDFDSFNVSPITKADLECGTKEVLGIVKGQLLTEDCGTASSVDCSHDTVKLFAAERHHGTGHRAACYLKGYGIKKGAVATSIAHDSHNIIAAGYDESIVLAVNELIKIGGGIVVTDGQRVMSLPLEIGGIMTARPCGEVAEQLEEIKRFAFSLGIAEGVDPFMTLSFLSLPVIPKVRLLPSGVVRM